MTPQAPLTPLREYPSFILPEYNTKQSPLKICPLQLIFNSLSQAQQYHLHNLSNKVFMLLLLPLPQSFYHSNPQ